MAENWFNNVKDRIKEMQRNMNLSELKTIKMVNCKSEFCAVWKRRPMQLSMDGSVLRLGEKMSIPLASVEKYIVDKSTGLVFCMETGIEKYYVQLGSKLEMVKVVLSLEQISQLLKKNVMDRKVKVVYEMARLKVFEIGIETGDVVVGIDTVNAQLDEMKHQDWKPFCLCTDSII